MTDERRVLLWTHRLAGADRRTGVGRYVVELTRALAAGRVGTDDEPSLRYELAAGPEREAASWIPSRVAVHRLGRDRRMLHLTWSIAHRPVIERWTGPVGLVHALAPSFPVPSRAPLVVTVHDLYPLEQPQGQSHFTGWANRRGLRWAFDHAAHLVTDSEHVRSRIIETTDVDPERVTACPLGVSERFASPVAPAVQDEALGRLGIAPRQYVLAVGAVGTRKNLPTLIAALAQLEPPLSIVIAGPPGDALAQVQQVIGRFGLDARVHVAGFVSDDALSALMTNALALAHPSFDEGFGFTPLEAMAGGTPAIVAASGSLPEVVGDAAIVVPSRDVEEWAASIARVRDDPDLRDRLADAGRSRARAFTWSRTAIATASVHRRVLGAS